MELSKTSWFSKFLPISKITYTTPVSRNDLDYLGSKLIFKIPTDTIKNGNTLIKLPGTFNIIFNGTNGSSTSAATIDIRPTLSSFTPPIIDSGKMILSLDVTDLEFLRNPKIKLTSSLDPTHPVEYSPTTISNDKLSLNQLPHF